jgi:iron complex transport system ATP-binding protein
MASASARYLGGRGLAMSEVTLRVERAQLVVLLGANGAGKSTLLRAAAGLLPAHEGEVRVGGRNVRALGPRDLSRQVAFVPQSEAPAFGFSVRDVVSMGRAPHQGAWMRASARDRAAVDEALERCDLVDLADRAVETLSGGEERRVAIARALAQEPMLLLLDEPAAFLDVRHRLDLHELLAAIVAGRHIACVVATHDLDAASRFAGRVVLMQSGRIVGAGAPDDVLTPAALREALGVEVYCGVDAATGQRYFLPRLPVAMSPKGNAIRAASLARAPDAPASRALRRP